ncbi:anthranilate phosphoribosyltransferase family protein [Synechococcus moorigangaii CMS01]|nr:anthranilate phosphoribosyltransferase family protein [Synechococcus moorigangaii CMS01]
MSTEFRELLKQVGSGTHTSKSLTRSEAAIALEMMLDGIATPAQIGAFLISQRIKRPTGIELAGMLDTYDHRSQKLDPLPNGAKVFVLGIPYDGRTKTAPIAPITALILKTAGIPVILHGGDRLPTKYGLPLKEIWQALGLDFPALSYPQLQTYFQRTQFAYCYTPTLLPDSQTLIPYREELGKRPSLATLELIWSPYGDHQAHTIAGYVHPPTEAIIRDTFRERGNPPYTLIKGLEGSGDLRISQTTIVVTNQTTAPNGIGYLKPNPYDYDLGGEDIALHSVPQYYADLTALLRGQPSPLMDSAVWNGGFYLWHCGKVTDLQSGLDLAETYLKTGQLQETLQMLQGHLAVKAVV